MEPSSFLQAFRPSCMSLNAIVSVASLVPHPSVLSVRHLTVAKTLSMKLVLLM
jgi:hypothetical protein